MAEGGPMAIRVQFLGMLTLACVLTLGGAAAQGLTGTLIGTVADQQGGVVQSALVTVNSPALIGGPTTMPTNDKGQFRLPALPPGPYSVVVEAPGFSPYREENTVLGAGATLERTVVLSLSGIAESIVVQAAGSRVEARSSGFETRFDQDYIRAIPGRRF